MRRFCGALVVLVAGLSVAATASAATSWRSLHRPLHLPKVQPGEACPVSRVDPRVDWDSANIFGGSGIGPGPVYPGLGGTRGHLVAGPGSFNGSVYREKVFWYADPSYRDRALIRGRRIDGSGRFRFEARRGSELRIRRRSTISWSGQPEGSRGVPSGVKFAVTGCYAVQIDGADFSRVAVFRASTP